MPRMEHARDIVLDEGAGEGWCQIRDILDIAAGGIRVVTITLATVPPGKSTEKFTVLAPTDVVALTEREAAKLGLV